MSEKKKKGPDSLQLAILESWLKENDLKLI